RGCSRSPNSSAANSTRRISTKCCPTGTAGLSSKLKRQPKPLRPWRWRSRRGCRRKRRRGTTMGRPPEGAVGGGVWRRVEAYADVRSEVDVNGRVLHVDVHRVNGSFVVTVDGHEWTIDAARVDAHTLSLLVGSSSQEVTIAPDTVAGQLAVGIRGVPLSAT